MASNDPHFEHILTVLLEDDGRQREALIAESASTHRTLRKFARDSGKINAMKWRKDLFCPAWGGNYNNTASTSSSTLSLTYAVSTPPMSLHDNYISGGTRLDLVMSIKHIMPCFVVTSPLLLFTPTSDYGGGLLSALLHITSIMTPTLSISYFPSPTNYVHIPSLFFAPLTIVLSKVPFLLVDIHTVWGAAAWNDNQLTLLPTGGNDVCDIAVGYFLDHILLMALYNAVSLAPNVCRSLLDPCIMTVGNVINTMTVLEDVFITEGLDSSRLADTPFLGTDNEDNVRARRSLLIHFMQTKLKFNARVEQSVQTWNISRFRGFLCDNLVTFMSLGTIQEEDNGRSVVESTVIISAADDFGITDLTIGGESDQFVVLKYGELKSWLICSESFGLLGDENDDIISGSLGSRAMSMLELIDLGAYSNRTRSTSKWPAIYFYLAARLQRYIDYLPVVADVTATEDLSFPSESNETFTRLVGNSAEVGHSCAFKVFNRETIQVSYRSCLRKVDLEVIKFRTSDEFRMPSAVLISTEEITGTSYEELLFTNDSKLCYPLCHHHCTRVFLGYICSTHGLPRLLLAQHRRIVDTPDIVWGDAAQEDQFSDSNSLISLLVHLWGVCFGFGFISCQDRSHFTCYDESISVGSVHLLRLYDASHCHQMLAVYVMWTKSNHCDGSVDFKSSVDVVSIIQGLDLIIMLDSLHPCVVIDFGLALWGAIERSSFTVTTYFEFKFIDVDAGRHLMPDKFAGIYFIAFDCYSNVPVKWVLYMSMVYRFTPAFINIYIATNGITHDFESNYELCGVLSTVTCSLGAAYKLYVDANGIHLKCFYSSTLARVIKICFGVLFNDHSFTSSVKSYSCRHISRCIVVESHFQCTTNQRITWTCNESCSSKLSNTWGAINEDDVYLNKRTSKWGAVNKNNVLSDISCCAVTVDDIHSFARISNSFDIFAASYKSNIGPIADIGADTNEDVSTLRIDQVSISMKVLHYDISTLSCRRTYTVHFRQVDCHISIVPELDDHYFGAYEDCNTVFVEDEMLVMDVKDSYLILDGNHRVTTLGTIDLEIVVGKSYGVLFKPDHLQLTYKMSEKSLTNGNIISMFLRRYSCWFRVHPFDLVTTWCIVTALLQHWNSIVLSALCTHFLGECCKWLDYGACFRASVSMVKYILVTIVHLWMRLKCDAVSISDDMRIASWGVSHLCKLGLETCLIRFVRIGIPF